MQAIDNFSIIVLTQMQLLISRIEEKPEHNAIAFVETDSKATTSFCSCRNFDLKKEQLDFLRQKITHFTSKLATFTDRNGKWNRLKPMKRLSKEWILEMIH